MKISLLLQPHIRRGEIAHNRTQIQTLIEQVQGELLVLPEYALTGSPALETFPNPRAWAETCAREKALLTIPLGKFLWFNFTPHNLERVLGEAQKAARSRRLLVLVSDQNNGKQPFYP